MSLSCYFAGETYIALVIFPLVGAGLALGVSTLCELKPSSTATIMIETSLQNVPLAMGILMASISDRKDQAEALGVPLVYGAIGNMVTLIYCVVLYKRGWSNADPKDNVLSAFARRYYPCCFAESEANTEVQEANSNVDLELQPDKKDLSVVLS